MINAPTEGASRFGLALVIAGLGLNPWLIGYLAAEDRSTTEPTRLHPG